MEIMQREVKYNRGACQIGGLKANPWCGCLHDETMPTFASCKYLYNSSLEKQPCQKTYVVYIYRVMQHIRSI